MESCSAHSGECTSLPTMLLVLRITFIRLLAILGHRMPGCVLCMHAKPWAEKLALRLQLQFEKVAACTPCLHARQGFLPCQSS